MNNADTLLIRNNSNITTNAQEEATGADGNIWLVAHVPETNSQNSGIIHPNCGALPWD